MLIELNLFHSVLFSCGFFILNSSVNFLNYFGSIQGVQPLLDGVLDYLPCPIEVSNYALDQNKSEEKVLTILYSVDMLYLWNVFIFRSFVFALTSSSGC